MMGKLITRFVSRRRRPGWELRRAGNIARDARNWRAANTAYADYLALNPDDWRLWVQRGHAQKEMGDLAGAERSYRRAADLASNDPDPFLHLGGLMDLMHRGSASIDFYRRAATLGDPDALRELNNRGIQVGLDASGAAVLLPWVTRETASRMLLDAQAARDQKRWEEAEALYLAYLAHQPDSAEAREELEMTRRLAKGF